MQVIARPASNDRNHNINGNPWLQFISTFAQNDTPLETGKQGYSKRHQVRNENVPKITINNTINLFFKQQLAFW